jgi:hypothetical protein
MVHKETNLEICQKLTEYFSRPENEQIRFFQGLSNLGLFKSQFDDRLNCTGVDDNYYESPEKTLCTISQIVK